MCPGNVKHLQEAYANATAKPYGDLFLEFKPNCHNYMRVRTNIFPQETPYYVYLPKK